jgi:hypothetical protein
VVAIEYPEKALLVVANPEVEDSSNAGPAVQAFGPVQPQFPKKDTSWDITGAE